MHHFADLLEHGSSPSNTVSHLANWHRPEFSREKALAGSFPVLFGPDLHVRKHLLERRKPSPLLRGSVFAGRFEAPFEHRGVGFFRLQERSELQRSGPGHRPLQSGPQLPASAGGLAGTSRDSASAPAQYPGPEPAGLAYTPPRQPAARSLQTFRRAALAA